MNIVPKAINILTRFIQQVKESAGLINGMAAL